MLFLQGKAAAARKISNFGRTDGGAFFIGFNLLNQKVK